MVDLFLGSEICEMAIETEKKGAAFYAAVAAGAQTPAVRQFCADMAAAEREHETTFSAMLAPLSYFEAPESYPGEYMDYVHALLERDVMPGEEAGRSLAANAQSEVEAVDFAIQFEKSTILFLHEMRNFVPESERLVVDKLIDEERSHVTSLAKLRRTLSA
jgi:rubrerythrin